MTTIFEKMQSHPIHLVLINEIALWRDEQDAYGDRYFGRKVVLSLSTIPIGLLGLIDVIGSFAIGILLSPSFLVGKGDWSLNWLERGKMGCIVTAFALSIFHLENFTTTSPMGDHNL